ncbi:DUF1572 family protein [Pseudopedobacter beijingensis]|uniref:DUF1572 family protein n=1 Tax=Pseudopedobacter beijingensis TaxID=1207056 RepID=A0ABW4IAY1_9SPHI
MKEEYLNGVKKQFRYYKLLADKTFDQLTIEQLYWKADESDNSIANLIMHLSGNMLSRWTDFFQSDGEKEWRKRDLEFEDRRLDRSELLNHWENGWDCFFNVLDSLKPEDLERIVFIRNQGHTVIDAINRQLAHYPYHIGQIVYIGKTLLKHTWQSLSIPKGNSQTYNEHKFEQSKHNAHFTDEFLSDEK